MWFNNYVLRAAKECITKGDRKYYNPYWNEDMNNELTTAINLTDITQIGTIQQYRASQC